MKKSFLLIGIFVVLITAIMLMPCLAQKKNPVNKEKPAAPAMSNDEKAEMEAWMKYATPGEEHKRLEYFVGEWSFMVKMWAKPGANPTVSNGTASHAMLLNGRYLQMNLHGTYLGKPFDGLGIVGYDNYNKTYLYFWIDSMGTGFWETKGAYDAATKTYTFNGIWDDPAKKTKDKVKIVIKAVDDNKFIYENYMIDAKGAEFKSMEATYLLKSK